jgi:hypothetical protein
MGLPIVMQVMVLHGGKAEIHQDKGDVIVSIVW